MDTDDEITGFHYSKVLANNDNGDDGNYNTRYADGNDTENYNYNNGNIKQ